MTVSLIGKRIGNYDIQSQLGEGGMGTVYLGIHPQIGKKVAVKVLHEELASKQDVVTRFFNEAKSVNDISHPNIVDIVDFGETNIDGAHFKYIIMEFLDGDSLSARIRSAGVTIRETLYIIAQAASALSASHQKGVVHRDLKPENIFLCGRGGDKNYVKLLDFGIAKLTGDQAALSQKTRTGMVIGTPAYMSPEQCEGRGLIDHRSDIYALGVVMYELLTGRVPFPGDGFGEVLVAHLTRDPPAPTTLNPNIPPEIEATGYGSSAMKAWAFRACQAPSVDYIWRTGTPRYPKASIVLPRTARLNVQIPSGVQWVAGERWAACLGQSRNVKLSASQTRAGSVRAAVSGAGRPATRPRGRRARRRAPPSRRR